MTSQILKSMFRNFLWLLLTLNQIGEGLYINSLHIVKKMVVRSIVNNT
jgi:hypothetical protein